MKDSDVVLGVTEFHRWTVIGFDANPNFWLCRCSCEAKTVRRVNKKNLKAHLSKSCGCWDQDRKTAHGMSGTRTYKLWQSMFNRVKNVLSYARKGITICDRWKGPEGFRNFLADMGECPADKRSLDRHPNKRGNYEPGNCRWATNAQQREKEATKKYEFNGRTQCLFEWADELGVTWSTLWGRLNRGWSVERAFTEPAAGRRGRGSPQTKDKLLEYQGRTQTLAQWAAEFDLNISTMIERVWGRWPMERIASTPQGARGGFNKARERNRLLRADSSLVKTGEVVMKYLSTEDGRRMLKDIIRFATSQEVEWMLNALCGGEEPKFDIADNLANRFCIRDHPL